MIEESHPLLSSSMPSLEGLATKPFFKAFTVAGNQILFWYDSWPGKMRQNAAIDVAGLGRVTYAKEVDTLSINEAIKWLDSIDPMIARRTMAFLGERAKKIKDAMGG